MADSPPVFDNSLTFSEVTSDPAYAAGFSDGVDRADAEIRASLLEWLRMSRARSNVFVQNVLNDVITGVEARAYEKK